MNDSSKGVYNDVDLSRMDFEVQHIAISDIVENRKNFYIVEDVSELMESIKTFGLQQNLTVVKEGNKYKLLSGHRRFKAIKGLGTFESVPCRVIKATKFEEDLLLILSNSTTRVLTEYEKMEQVSRLKKIVKEVKTNDKLLIKGRVRDFIANSLGVSSSTVGRYEAINNNLNDDLKEEYRSGNINTTVAYETSKLDAEKQEDVKKAIDKGENLKVSDIKSIESDVTENVSIMDTNENYVYENQMAIDEEVKKTALEKQKFAEYKEQKEVYEGVLKVINKIKVKDELSCKYFCDVAIFDILSEYIANVNDCGSNDILDEKFFEDNLPSGNFKELQKLLNNVVNMWIYNTGCVQEIEKRVEKASEEVS